MTALLLLVAAVARADRNTAVMTLEFCGDGINGATNYLGPLAAWGADGTIGGATCSALDNTTIATADGLPYGLVTGYTVLSMVCEMTETGSTDDTVTYTLMDDTVAVPGFSCTTGQLNNSGSEKCSVSATPVYVVGSSQMAVRQVRSSNDDLSGTDAACYVFVRF